MIPLSGRRRLSRRRAHTTRRSGRSRGSRKSLAQEVARFGIKVTLVEPSGYSTDWDGSSATHADAQPQYDGLRAAIPAQQAGGKIADAGQPPLRVIFGSVPTVIAPQVYAQRLQTWEEWKDLSVAADGD